MSQRITKDEALRILRALADAGDVEAAHADADEVLVALVNDDEIEAAYEAVPKWYA